MPEPTSQGWNDYAQLVLHTLDRFELCFKDVQGELGGLRTEIAKMRAEMAAKEIEDARCITELKVKSGVWGAIAGFIPSACVAIYFFLANIGKN